MVVVLQGAAHLGQLYRRGVQVGSHSRKVYVGIDVHRQEHKVAIMPLSILECSEQDWRRAKLLAIRNNASDFEQLDTAITEYAPCPDEVVIAVDHTGGHYSEPLVYFLQTKGYNVYHLEPKGAKAIFKKFLGR